MSDQSPSCCQFCGAGIHARLNSNADFVNFACGSAWSRGSESPRQLQSEACATAERERLTRERDDWKRVAEGLNAFMERARSKTDNTRESLECLREFDALKSKEAELDYQ